MIDKTARGLAAVGLVLAALAMLVGAMLPPAAPAGGTAYLGEAPAATATSLAGMSAGVYMAPGGNQLVVEDAGYIEIRGGTLLAESGSTVGFDTLTITDTLAIDGALTVNDNAEITGTLTVNAVTVTTTVSAEQLTSTDDATVTDALGTGSLTVGDGYGSTGCSISAAGVLQCDGAMTGASSLTIDSISIGGGYTGSGSALSNAGAGQFNSTLTVDGAAALNGGITVDTTAFTVADATGNVATAGTLDVAGASTLGGVVTINDNATVTGTLDVDGAATFDGGFTVDTTAFTVANTTGNVATAGTLDVAGASTLGGVVTINDNATVTGTLNVNGATDLDSTLNVDGVATHGADVRVDPDSTGGNAGAKNEYIGLPRIKFVDLAQGTNGSTETTVLVDDSPTGEYAPINANVVEAEGSVDGIFKFGSSSYKAVFTDTAVADDGFKATIAGDDMEANEYIGLLLYSDTAISSGDLQILLTDDTAGAQNFAIGAVPAEAWTWCEVSIAALAGGSGDVITEFGVTLTAQGAAALGEFSLYLDVAYKWDDTDEEDLGAAIVQDGVINVLTIPTAAGTGNTWNILTEGTGYFVTYRTGNDYVVWITDQSANEILAFVAY